MTKIFLSVLIGIYVASISSVAISAEIVDATKYNVYFGDFNDDGTAGDIYFHGKESFVLIHGEIAIPLFLAGPAGFVFYSGGTGILQDFDLHSTTLNDYTLASEGQDYVLTDFNGDGTTDFEIASPTATDVKLRISFSTGTASPSLYIPPLFPKDPPRASYDNGVAKIFDYDALSRLTKLSEDGVIKVKYCLDPAGNRREVLDTGEDCAPPPVAPPTYPSWPTRRVIAGVELLTWGSVPRATSYRVLLGIKVPGIPGYPKYAVTSSTSYNPNENEVGYSVKACNSGGCSTAVGFHSE